MEIECIYAAVYLIRWTFWNERIFDGIFHGFSGIIFYHNLFSLIKNKNWQNSRENNDQPKECLYLHYVCGYHFHFSFECSLEFHWRESSFFVVPFNNIITHYTMHVHYYNYHKSKMYVVFCRFQFCLWYMVKRREKLLIWFCK